MPKVMRVVRVVVGALVISAILVVGGSAAVASSSDVFGEFGGVTSGPKNQPSHTSAWVNVWKTGHSPIGGWTTYRYHGWVQIQHGLDDNIDSFKTNAWYTNEQWPAETMGTVAKTNRVYGCVVGNRWRERGCFYLMRKGKVRYNQGGTTLICYPKVEAWIRADSNSIGSGLIKFNWTSNNNIFC
jgi:hypothetical protein